MEKEMFHFFVDSAQISLDSKVLEIDGSDYNHIANVLRMKVGEEISVSTRDGDPREYRYGIEEITEDKVICKLRFIKEDGVELPSKIYLFQGLPKADKMELIIQKAVELGAYAVIPVSTKRAIVRLDEKKAAKKIERWQAISESAAKQSKRGIIPEVMMPMTYKNAIQYAQDLDIKLIPYEMAKDMSHTRQLIDSIEPGKSVGIFIGPEGGFDDAEIQYAMENGVEPVTLGKRILRTETAGFTIISWLMYHLERD
jgi:16S rRNA (uracil1498-N3)-methyltransferase